MKPSNQGGVSVTRIYIDIDVDEIDIDREDKIFVQSVYLYIYVLCSKPKIYHPQYDHEWVVETIPSWEV